MTQMEIEAKIAELTADYQRSKDRFDVRCDIERENLRKAEEDYITIRNFHKDEIQKIDEERRALRLRYLDEKAKIMKSYTPNSDSANSYEESHFDK